MIQELAELKPQAPSPTRRSRWKSRLKWLGLITLAAVLVAAFIVKDYVRTLSSLRRVPGTNAFVMDYYLDYHLDEIRQRGMDVKHLDDSCLETLFPDFTLPVMSYFKRQYLPKPVRTTDHKGDHCSTIVLSQDDRVFFGRNFDYYNDVFLILRVHDREGLASIAVIDLKYLNLNRQDLDQTTLMQRFALLGSPYYLMDGMNRHGVAVADMAVKRAEPPVDPGKPNVIHSTLMRLIIDYAKNVDDAVDLAKSYNVSFVETPVHLMVADASGQSRVIEFIDGKIRITSNDDSWQLCTNHVIWQKSEQEKDDTCRRYKTGSELAESIAHLDEQSAERITRSMSVDNYTMWTSLYDLKNLRAHITYRAKIDAGYSDAIPHPASRSSSN
jgi:predicted choloylglycine hydrolase